MKARIRETELFFDVEGGQFIVDGTELRERQTAMLTHGGPGVDHSVFRIPLGELSRQIQLVYFDQRGHGRSARGDPTKYTLDENVEDLEALRIYLGLGPVVSIGASYGGRVVMAHASRYPNSVSHLVLIATSAHGGSSIRAREIVLQRGTKEQIKWFEDMQSGGIDSESKLRCFFQVMGPLYSRKLRSGSLQGLAGAILSVEAFHRAHGPDGFLRNLDLRSELNRIVAKSLIIGARHDFMCAPEFSEELHRLIHGSQLRIFENSGHSIGSDEPQKLRSTIAAFLGCGLPHATDMID